MPSTLVATHASEHWVKRKRWSSHHGNPQETLFSVSIMNTLIWCCSIVTFNFIHFDPIASQSHKEPSSFWWLSKRNENQPPVRTGGPVMWPTRKGEPAVRTGNSWKQTTCEGNARIPPSYEFSGQASKSPWLLWPNPPYLKQINSLHWTTKLPNAEVLHHDFCTCSFGSFACVLQLCKRALGKMKLVIKTSCQPHRNICRYR